MKVSNWPLNVLACSFIGWVALGCGDTFSSEHAAIGAAIGLIVSAIERRSAADSAQRKTPPIGRGVVFHRES